MVMKNCITPESYHCSGVLFGLSSWGSSRAEPHAALQSQQFHIHWEVKQAAEVSDNCSRESPGPHPLPLSLIYFSLLLPPPLYFHPCFLLFLFSVSLLGKGL